MESALESPPAVRDGRVAAELGGEAVRRVARSRLAQLGVPEQELDDLTQETLTALLTAKAAFDPNRGSLGSWVSGFAANVAKSWWRKSGERRRMEAPLEEEECEPGHDPTTRLFDAFAEPFGTLNSLDQDLLRFRYSQRLSFEEIGRMTSISAVAARKRVSRSLARLRALSPRPTFSPRPNDASMDPLAGTFAHLDCQNKC
ncbi:MAG: sigma-70 family RNA polymerase sigma factor [Fimbriimonadaceae bacterium]|nr:sigma-70 family RNA polymerase sigma factor [Fimbriimonadaceae bacterium]